MISKQTLNLRQAGNNTIDIPLTTLHGYYNVCTGWSLPWKYKHLLSKAIPTLEVQTVSLWINPYAGGTNSWYLKLPLRSWYKQLLSKGIPTLKVQTVGSCFLKASLLWRYK